MMFGFLPNRLWSVSSFALIVSFRQACMNLFEACGIVGCQRRTLWRTADGYQEETRSSCPAGGPSAAIRAVAADA